VFSIPSIYEYDGKPLVSIEKADLNITPDADEAKPEGDEVDTAPLIALFKEVLGDKVEDVVASKRLVDSAATLVAGKQGMDAQMERVMKMMDKEFSGSKRILELNLTHPLIQNLARLHAADSSSVFLRDCATQIYQGASLIDNTLSTPAEFVQRMTEIMVKATQ
jgi:molecular chaperone HtpG